MDRSKSLFVYGLCLVGPALAAGRPDGKDEGILHSKAPAEASSSVIATPVPMSAVSTQAAFSAIASLVPLSAMRSVASVPSASPASIQHPEVASAVNPEASSIVAKASSVMASSIAAPASSLASAAKSGASSAVAPASSLASAAKSEASSAVAPASSVASAVKSEASSAVASANSVASSAVASAKESAASVIAPTAISSPASAMRSMVPSAAPSSVAPSIVAASMSLSVVSSVIAHSAVSSAPEAPKTTPKPTTARSTPYIDDWRTRATWPVGCEEWANPCPQGVPLENGGTARTLSNNYVPVGSQSGYTNGFTSYLTMTDENGVVTGMPPVATLPAGVSKLPDWVTKTSPASKPAAPSTMFVAPVPAQVKSSKALATAAHATQSAGAGVISTHNSASSISRTLGISFVFGLIGAVAVHL